MKKKQSTCPGCGLNMPVNGKATYDGNYNTTPECWSVYTEVLGAEFSNALLFGKVHQLTVDSYAVQHAGAAHKDKSVTVHLAGLYLVLERDLPPASVAPLLQQLAQNVSTWPQFEPPRPNGPVTVFDVAMAGSIANHIEAVRNWATLLWQQWSVCHQEIQRLVKMHIPLHEPLPTTTQTT